MDDSVGKQKYLLNFLSVFEFIYLPEAYASGRLQKKNGIANKITCKRSIVMKLK